MSLNEKAPCYAFLKREIAHLHYTKDKNIFGGNNAQLFSSLQCSGLKNDLVSLKDRGMDGPLWVIHEAENRVQNTGAKFMLCHSRHWTVLPPTVQWPDMVQSKLYTSLQEVDRIPLASLKFR